LLLRAPSGSRFTASKAARLPDPPGQHWRFAQGTEEAPRVGEPRRPSSCSALWVHYHLFSVTVPVSSFTLIQAYPVQSDCLDRSSCFRELPSLVVRALCLSQALRAFLSAVCRSVDVPVNVLWRDLEPATAVYGSFPPVVTVSVGVAVLAVARDDGEAAEDVTAAAGPADVAELTLVGATRRLSVGVAAASVWAIIAGLAWLGTTGRGGLRYAAAASAEFANVKAPAVAVITATAPIAVAFALIFARS